MLINIDGKIFGQAFYKVDYQKWLLFNIICKPLEIMGLWAEKIFPFLGEYHFVDFRQMLSSSTGKWASLWNEGTKREAKQYYFTQKRKLLVSTSRRSAAVKEDCCKNINKRTAATLLLRAAENNLPESYLPAYTNTVSDSSPLLRMTILMTSKQTYYKTRRNLASSVLMLKNASRKRRTVHGGEAEMSAAKDVAGICFWLSVGRSSQAVVEP